MRRHWFATLVAGLWASLTAGEVVITYESFNDETPNDPSVDVCLGCSATIEVRLAPTNGQPFWLTWVNFSYDGDDLGDGVLENGGIVLSSHLWDEVFEPHFVWHELPHPIYAPQDNGF